MSLDLDHPALMRLDAVTAALLAKLRPTADPDVWETLVARLVAAPPPSLAERDREKVSAACRAVGSLRGALTCTQRDDAERLVYVRLYVAELADALGLDPMPWEAS